MVKHHLPAYNYYYNVGERYHTANVHHFTDSVVNLGPLWAHLAFPFENANGWLRELYHGSTDPTKQVRTYR